MTPPPSCRPDCEVALHRGRPRDGLRAAERHRRERRRGARAGAEQPEEAALDEDGRDILLRYLLFLYAYSDSLYQRQRGEVNIFHRPLC